MEVFDLIRKINDPEHPLTLEQLKVVSLEDVEVDDAASRVRVEYTPTIPHCSMVRVFFFGVPPFAHRSLAHALPRSHRVPRPR